MGGFSVKFDSYNLITKSYEFTQYVTLKFDIVLQTQESKIAVVQERNSVKVRTASMQSCNVDKKCKRISDPVNNQKKSFVQNSKNVLDDFTKTVFSISADEYKKWEELSFYNIMVQKSVSTVAVNKLKAKRWYDAHPPA